MLKLNHPLFSAAEIYAQFKYDFQDKSELSNADIKDPERQ